jgi:hypothetical protein
LSQKNFSPPRSKTNKNVCLAAVAVRVASHIVFFEKTHTTTTLPSVGSYYQNS